MTSCNSNKLSWKEYGQVLTAWGSFFGNKTSQGSFKSESMAVGRENYWLDPGSERSKDLVKD